MMEKTCKDCNWYCHERNICVKDNMSYHPMMFICDDNFKENEEIKK